ncbi:MAG: EAL domain-containing protein, partial [Alphaproteobacteria bacterium]|nr:EAL domain-containing protein [Alphaproteobacteria bacterium]
PQLVLTQNSDPHWYIVSRVPTAIWTWEQIARHKFEGMVLLLLLLVFAFGSWRIAVNRTIRAQLDELYQKRLSEALDESERRNTAVVEASDDAIMTCTENGAIRHVNRATAKMFQMEREDMNGRDIGEFVMDPKQISERLPDGEIRLMERDRFETYAVRATGEGFPAEMTVTPIHAEGQGRYSIFIRDISLRRSIEERLKRLANYDPLTGLANRALLIDHLDRILSDTSPGQEPYAVIMGDLDDFRIVNDTLGHVIGDETLKVAAGRIHQQNPSGGLACRFGGDEFVLVIPCRGDHALPGQVCESIIQAFDTPVVVASHRLHIGISLGVAFAQSKHDTATSLLQMADTAMYSAKEAGRNMFRVFSRAMHENMAKHLNIQSRLAGALERGDLRLMFQPLIDARSKRVIGAEALMRWRDRDLGDVGPQDFIPVAESSGQIIEFGAWALEEAGRLARQWRDVSPDFHVAVNISPVQLIGSDIAATVRSVLARHDLAPDALDVEITEGLLIKDPVEAESTLRSLSETGVSISIDDFGTGYSSLSYLQRYPFTTLKIDREFVMGLPDSRDSRTLVTAVLALAGGQGLKVVAEGVETEGQA